MIAFVRGVISGSIVAAVMLWKRMEPGRTRAIALTLLLILCCPAFAGARDQPVGEDEAPPSEAMLEFLGDLEPVDDETWRLLEHHALRDMRAAQEVNDE